MMKFRQFEAEAEDKVSELLIDGLPNRNKGANYKVERKSSLEHAINTSLALGRPLLVSGDPGCGKTELGFAIARKLGIRSVKFFATKSDSEAQKLFYEFDTLRRFHAAQIQDSRKLDAAVEVTDPRNFIRYQALGRAILDASPQIEIQDLLPTGEAPLSKPERSVVIIDELDKAPRDFPNDLLNELDQNWFRIPELVGWVKQAESPRLSVDNNLKPIVVITSNLERQLPDAFLRRCVFHHISQPTDPAALEEIVVGHLESEKDNVSNMDVKSSIELFLWAREQNFEKHPGLAELLEFVRAISYHAHEFQELPFKERATACVSAMGKTTRDQALLVSNIAQIKK